MKNKEFKIAPVIACIITMLCVGIVYMWNVFQQPVMDYYGWEKTAVSFISAVNLFASKEVVDENGDPYWPAALGSFELVLTGTDGKPTHQRHLENAFDASCIDGLYY